MWIPLTTSIVASRSWVGKGLADVEGGWLYKLLTDLFGDESDQSSLEPLELWKRNRWVLPWAVQVKTAKAIPFNYPLVNVYILKITTVYGKNSVVLWPCSMSMLVYQEVFQLSLETLGSWNLWLAAANALIQLLLSGARTCYYIWCFRWGRIIPSHPNRGWPMAFKQSMRMARIKQSFCRGVSFLSAMQTSEFPHMISLSSPGLLVEN